MHSFRFPIHLALTAALCLAQFDFADEPVLLGIGAAMQEMVAKDEVVGAVSVVVAKDKSRHIEIFWIASMTKPITGAAVLMLQEKGKLLVADPVALVAFGDAPLWAVPPAPPGGLRAWLLLRRQLKPVAQRERRPAFRTPWSWAMRRQ